MRVIVVGAGVVGLSAAVRLAESGHRVDVVARDLPGETVSAVAGGFWYPYRALPQERVSGWAATTYDVLAGLAASDPDAGVVLREGTEVLRAPRAEPDWSSAVSGFARAVALPAGYADGWSFAAPVAQMPTYLRWLVGRLERAGGTLTRMNLTALPATGDGVDLVVNCAGLGARHLGDDPSVVPVAGQVVVLARPGGVERWWLDGAGDPADAADPRGLQTYVLPRVDDVVVGGTAVEGEWNRTPDPALTQLLLDRAYALEPRLEGARVLRVKVGLRPVRPTVRLERTGDVVHCYGHGGAGVTLSWGCADEVVALAEGPTGT